MGVSSPLAPLVAAGSGDERRAAVLELQRMAGNRAVNRIFEPPMPRAEPSGPPDFAGLIRRRDVSGIKAVPRGTYADATPSQRLLMIWVLLNQGWVGPRDEWAIEALWDTFGSSVISVASKNAVLWNDSIKAGAELGDIASVRRVRSAFAQDVKQLAHVYMRGNRQAVMKEASRLGLGALAGGSAGTTGRTTPGAGPGPDRAAILQIQQLTREAARADQLLGKLRAIPVGYNWESFDRGMGARMVRRVPASYDPAKPPAQAPGAGERGFASYADVDRQYKAVQQARAAILARSPAIFGATEQGRAGALARQSPEAAAAMLRTILATTLGNINETEPKIDSGDLDWRDLVPLHNQLYRGLPSASGTPWGNPIYQSVAKDVIGDYKATQFWVNLGLGSLAAAAFIFSSLATGGLATVLWASAGVAVGAGQAAASWERYEDVVTAHGAATSEETRLVGQAEVSEALLSAVLDTAFAFVDALGAAKGVATAVRATAARKALGSLASASKTEARAAVERGVRELGPQETIRRSGQTPEELLAIVGKDSEAGRAIQSASRDVTIAPHAAGGAEEAVAATAESRRLAGRLQGLFLRWREMSPRARLDALTREVNADLVRQGVPKLDWVILDKGSKATRGKLNFTQWELAVHRGLLTDSNISAEAFAGLADTVRHEAEHAVQWFRMAQLQAMKTGDNAAKIAKDLGIPEEIVEAAIEVQVGRRAGARLVEGSKLTRAAETFFESVYGATSKRTEIYDVMDAAEDAYREASRRWDKVRRLPASDGSRRSAKRELDAAHSRLDTAMAAYRNLPEEVAARQAGGAAQTAVKEHLGLVASLESARRAERAAYKAYKPLEDFYITVTSMPNHHLTYDRLLDYYRAMDRWKRAFDAVHALERSITRHAKGAVGKP